MASVKKVHGVQNAHNEVNSLLEFNRAKSTQGQYLYVYIKLLADGRYDIGLLKEKPYNPNYYNQLFSIYGKDVDKVKSRENKINKLVERINKSAKNGNEIKDVSFAKRLMNERMNNKLLDHDVWKFLSFDKSSGKHFKEIPTDPTLTIIFVDINYLRNHRGNKIIFKKEDERIGKSVEKVRELLESGVKMNGVPIFYIRDGTVGEGNHRVEALYQMGYRSVPVYITGAWD